MKIILNMSKIPIELLFKQKNRFINSYIKILFKHFNHKKNTETTKTTKINFLVWLDKKIVQKTIIHKFTKLR